MNLALHSLYSGRWFKLICGASFHHLPSIHGLAQIYTLAGADCLDLAADPAIVEAAQAGIRAALARDPQAATPLLMASFNDGEDPHFRKAQIRSPCPTACPQPCLSICPPQAIGSWAGSDAQNLSGEQVWVLEALCYGCGRCLTVCPADRIRTVDIHTAAVAQLPQLWQAGVRAIEIHTQVGRSSAFRDLWASLSDWIPRLEVVSVSVGDGTGLERYLWDLVEAMVPSPAHLIWQLDGRPMSGDIGVGTTRATLRLAQRVSAWGLPGILQLAGGTNRATVPQIPADLPVGGVAYGSYARQLVAPGLEGGLDEAASADLAEAVAQARSLVAQVKSRVPWRSNPTGSNWGQEPIR